MTFTDKKVVITGGVNGIGYETGKHLLENGISVSNNYKLIFTRILIFLLVILNFYSVWPL